MCEVLLLGGWLATPPFHGLIVHFATILNVYHTLYISHIFDFSLALLKCPFPTNCMRWVLYYFTISFYLLIFDLVRKNKQTSFALTKPPLPIKQQSYHTSGKSNLWE